MGYGSWSDSSFRAYSSAKGRTVDSSGAVSGSYRNQDMFRASNLDKALDPKGVIRECRDSAEHPNVVPVILALDVTGSMGEAAVEVAKKINIVMTELYKTYPDVQFMIMGIGDMACDRCPAQATQFESDIRIADQLEKIYFEFGGGGNSFESYSLAWYFALNHTSIDAIEKRGKKGIIITMGDEPLNPYLPVRGSRASMKEVFGDDVGENIDTKALYDQVKDKFECFHIHVDHNSGTFYSFKNCKKSFVDVMGNDHVISATLNTIAKKITELIVANAEFDTTATQDSGIEVDEKTGDIAW